MVNTEVFALVLGAVNSVVLSGFSVTTCEVVIFSPVVTDWDV
ncbi:MAG: hypothetical protein ACR5KV_06170 [Wolbachia sp.]